VGQKGCHFYYFYHNFGKCSSIIIVLSSLNSEMNYRRSWKSTCYLLLPHYPVKTDFSLGVQLSTRISQHSLLKVRLMVHRVFVLIYLSSRCITTSLRCLCDIEFVNYVFQCSETVGWLTGVRLAITRSSNLQRFFLGRPSRIQPKPECALEK